MQEGAWEWFCPQCHLKFYLDEEAAPDTRPLGARLMKRMGGVFAMRARCPICGQELTDAISWVGMLVFACNCKLYAVAIGLEGYGRELMLLDRADLLALSKAQN